MSWSNGFFAKTMIPDHHAVQIPLTKRQHALDISTKFLGVAEGIDVDNLSKRVFKLQESGKITTEMAQWAKIIRLDGNASIHSDEEFTESEARELLNFVETFLLYSFTLPEMVAANKHT
ncbi:hypothetical protein Xedl_03727 [Xenorhabdus eapokensis]|uniref:DUF4145 domain-containing protein n=2 Tax=Xenorhabdus eapokensis TaxID=1873482 RepID=A0A1Q5TGL6_9GAMM|nr:hypothetical protein Xedl_03727 [Xenorhabdus eapokensis]